MLDDDLMTKKRSLPLVREEWQLRFLRTLSLIALECWQTSENHGFHEARRVNDPDPVVRNLSDSTALLLIVSELSEALEGLRHGNPLSDKVPEFTAMEEELADAIIRILDIAVSRGHRIGPAMLAKMEYNQGRPHLHGGKLV